MCKLKIGDSVIISNKNLNKSDLEQETPYVIARITDNNVFLKVNESTIVGVSCDEVKKINPDYLKSNRYLLSLAVKGSGFSAKALSRALVGNESYFYNKTGEARFIKNGDVSNDYYSQLLIDVSTAVDILNGTKKQVDSELDFDLSLIKSESKEIEFKPTGYETPEDFNQDLKVTPEEVQGRSLPSVEDSEKGLKELAKKINDGVASIQILESSHRKLGKTAEEKSETLSEKAERKGAFILMSVIIILILIFTYLAFK